MACARLPSTSKELLRGGDALGEVVQAFRVLGHAGGL
jgi:hypothetical protein